MYGDLLPLIVGEQSDKEGNAMRFRVERYVHIEAPDAETAEAVGDEIEDAIEEIIERRGLKHAQDEDGSLGGGSLAGLDDESRDAVAALGDD